MQSLNYVTLFNYRCFRVPLIMRLRVVFSLHGTLPKITETYYDTSIRWRISLLFHFNFSNSTTFTREVRLKKFLRENFGMWYFLDKYCFQWIDGAKWIKSMISTPNYKSKSKFFKNLNKWKSTNLLIYHDNNKLILLEIYWNK